MRARLILKPGQRGTKKLCAEYGERLLYRRFGSARLLFEHGYAQDHFGCSVFWVRRMAAIGGEKAAMEDWQIKRDGTERGIVEIIGD